MKRRKMCLGVPRGLNFDVGALVLRVDEAPFGLATEV